MTRQERAYRLVYQDGTISRAMTRNEAENEYRYPTVVGRDRPWPAEVVHVVLRKSGAFREEANNARQDR